MARRTRKTKPLTTAQRLSSIVKSCRDIMRKDKGLNGDLDRLPILIWIMFLKFLDDMEKIDEDRAALAGEPYRPTLEAPYRWRDWASDEAGVTGDELIAFINNDEAMRPDGIWGAGLLAYLRSLQSANGRDRRDVIARVFEGTVNRMINGFLMRDVINKVDEIHFSSSDEMHTLSHLYETMLKEMRDAAGDSGEFYTPRPVVKFMVAVTNPQLGETVLDPACGTGGFLVEAFEHLRGQAETVEDQEILQAATVLGGEAKPLPYLLAQMNLLLHGLRYPRIDYGNSLGTPLRDIRDDERVDVILTNPPFGGKEESGILSNFPEDKRTAETALLFMQLIARKLKCRTGRAAVIVPNGTLSAAGVAARIKEELLQNFNLHTIVRLPSGVFAPYSPNPTNILFFDSTNKTEGIWYFEIPLPDERKNYTKTNPIRYEDFADCRAWWNRRGESAHAWYVPVDEVMKYDETSKLASVDLDIKNPNASDLPGQLQVTELISRIQTRETTILEQISEMRDLAALFQTALGSIWVAREDWTRKKVKHLASIVSSQVDPRLEPYASLPHINGEVIESGTARLLPDYRTAREDGIIGSKYHFRANTIIYSKIRPYLRKATEVPFEGVCSTDVYAFEAISDELLPRFFMYSLLAPAFSAYANSSSRGTRIPRINRRLLFDFEMCYPSKHSQRGIVEYLDELQSRIINLKHVQAQTQNDLDALLPSVLDRVFSEK